jgi:hypothetical protein
MPTKKDANGLGDQRLFSSNILDVTRKLPRLAPVSFDINLAS